MAALTLTLDRRARKYLTWTARLSDTDVTVRLNLGRTETWHPVEVIPTGTAGADGLVPVDLRVLAAGPDATGNPGGTVVVPLGVNVCTLEVPDTPEVDVAPHGVIIVR